VLPFLLTTNVYLVTLYSAIKRLCISLRVKKTYLLKHIPSGILSHLNVPCKLVGTDTLLVRRDKVHSQEPLDEWQLGILEDSTNEAREILATVLASELTVLASHTVMTTTVRAYYVTVRPSTLYDGLFAFLVRVKV
jgi:hypothetical protein